MAGTKWSALSALLGANVTGSEIVCVGDNPTATYTASTISAAESDNSINDSANGLPVIPVGKLVRISGFTDTEGELNADHTVVTSTPSKLVVSTDITVDEAAGDSVTVEQIDASYKMTLDQLAVFVAAGGLQDTGSTVVYISETMNSAASGALDCNAAMVFWRALTGNITFSLTNAPTVNASKRELIISNGSSHIVTWPVDWIWEGGSAPTLGSMDRVVLSFYAGDTGPRALHIPMVA